MNYLSFLLLKKSVFVKHPIMGTIYTGFNIWWTNDQIIPNPVFFQQIFHWSKLQTQWLSCLLSMIIIFLGEKIHFFFSQQLIKRLKKSPFCFSPVDIKKNMKSAKQNFIDGGKYQTKCDLQRKISRNIWSTKENIKENFIDRVKYQVKTDWRSKISSKIWLTE